MKELVTSPFFQVTLPLMVTFVAAIWAATWAQNKRLDDIIKRLDKIETKLDGHAERIAKLEGPPLVRRSG